MPWSDLIPFDTSGRLSAIDEPDYRLTTQVDARAQRELLEEVLRGAYQLEPFTAHDVAAAAEVMRGNANLGTGLADASASSGSPSSTACGRC